MRLGRFSTPLAIALGFGLGLLLFHYRLLSKRNTAYVFALSLQIEHLLEFIVTYHILSRLFIGLSKLKVAGLRGKLAVRSLVYFILNSLLAVSIGLLVPMLFQPEVFANIGGLKGTENEAPLPFPCLIKDLLKNLFPSNLLMANFQVYKTQNLQFNLETDVQNTNNRGSRLVGGNVEVVNILGLVTLCFIVWLSLWRYEEETAHLVDLLMEISELMIRFHESTSGFFTFGLFIFGAQYAYKDGLGFDTLVQLVKLAAACISGLIIYGMVFLPLIYLVLVRRNPFVFLKGVWPVMLSAVSPTGRCTEINGIDRRVTDSMLPAWRHINMGGTAVYEVIIAVLISGFSNIGLNWVQLLTLSVVVVLSRFEMRNPRAISSVIVYLLLILGIPRRGICPLMMIHWALSWLCTPVNTLGFCVGASVVERLSRKELAEPQEIP